MNLATEKVILVALAKLFSEQSTYIQGELKQQIKMRFHIAVNGVDSFINEIESKLSEHDAETLRIITDALHEGMTGLRADLNKELTETNKP